MKDHILFLWILFAVFMGLSLMTGIDGTVVLNCIACILAVILIRKAGLPSVRYFMLAVILAFLAMVAYLGYQRDPGSPLSMVGRLSKRTIT